jgi:hypothetical protein
MKIEATKEQLVKNLKNTIRLKREYLLEQKYNDEVGARAVKAFLPLWIQDLERILAHVELLPDDKQ